MNGWILVWYVKRVNRVFYCVLLLWYQLNLHIPIFLIGYEGLLMHLSNFLACNVIRLLLYDFQQSQHILHHLAMFFRDELLSWSWRRPLGIPSVPVAPGMINPLEFQQKVINNVEHVINRIKSISPHYLAHEVCCFFYVDSCLLLFWRKICWFLICSDWPSQPLAFIMMMPSL